MNKPLNPKAVQNENFNRITITIPSALEQELRNYAIREERAMSWIIQKALIEYLKKHK